MKEVLKKFGRYFLLDQIAQGGMAEIYRARLASREGAGRLIVIKRIQAGYGSNNEFLQMFKSEIKVTMSLNHPNVAQLFDFGSEDGLPYIAMELVDGKNLRQVLTRFNEVKQPFPVELAAFIIEQAACGLGYAHAFKDKITGEPLNIIHRDISPQNILISYEGTVKVIDFGIAKATVNSDFTRAGVIKGKPSYLSPEQISGDTLDGRCDIFALGTVLWELLTGRKLFSGENDLAVLKQIESVQTHLRPPSAINAKVPKELDYIVLKALAKQRDKRYQTATELQRALHKFVYNYMPDFDPVSLGYIAKELFKDEILEDRKRVQRLNDRVEQLLYTGDDESTGISAPQKTKKEDTTTALEPIQKSTGAREAFHQESLKNANVEIDLSKMLKNGSSPKPLVSSQQIPTPSRMTGGGTRMTSTQRHSQPSYSNDYGTSQGGGDWGKIAFFAAAAIVTVAALGPKFGIDMTSMPGISTLKEMVSSRKEAKLILQGDEKNVIVEVDGQEVARSLPATVHSLPAGRTVQVVVSSTKGLFKTEVTLEEGESKKVAVNFVGRDVASQAPIRAVAPEIPKVTLRLSVVGRDRVPVSPNGLSIYVNNQPIPAEQPIVNVPLDSPLLLVIDNPRYRRFEREFKVSRSEVSGKEHMMTVELEPIKFGKLTIRTYPSAAFATIKGEGRVWEKETPLEEMDLPVGTYEVRLRSLVYDEKMIRNVKVEDRRLTKVVEQLEIKN
jgi:serine/threonine protein kinase